MEKKLIKIRVFAGSSREGIVQKKEDHFDILTKEKPIEGRANKSSKAILSKYFKIPENKITILKGFRSKNKIFQIFK